jgi:hypothetical protein
MLDKLVIHLKNIIFFKTIIYIIAISLLFSLTPILQEELTKASTRKEKARGFLSQAMVKLNSIVDFEDKIMETNEAYHKLIENKEQNECGRKTKLLEAFDIISKKYQLSRPISMQVTRLFNHSNTKTHSDMIVMREDLLELDFSSPNTDCFLEISQAIAQTLPEGSIILTASIRKNESLSADIIDMLSESKAPDLFQAKMKIKLREVIYEK